MKAPDFKKLCQNAKVAFQPQVVANIKTEWKALNQAINHLKTINIDGVEPFVRISPPIDFSQLRNDEIDQSVYLNKTVALKNASAKDQDFVIIKKII